MGDRWYGLQICAQRSANCFELCASPSSSERERHSRSCCANGVVRIDRPSSTPATVLVADVES